jgi:hypothetical protein
MCSGRDYYGTTRKKFLNQHKKIRDIVGRSDFLGKLTSELRLKNLKS